MPYIEKEKRHSLHDGPVTPGELNYQISQVINLYLIQKGISYTTFNEIIGALECEKLEIYRRLVAPYEDIKLKENGEVYHLLRSED